MVPVFGKECGLRGKSPRRLWYRENHEPRRTAFQRTVLDPAATLTIYPEVNGPKPDNSITVFDSVGELVYFQGFLPEAARGELPTPTDRFNILAAVGFDSTALTPETPEQPPAFATDWAAWRAAGSNNGLPTQRIDAAVTNGHLTYFSRGSDGDEVLRRLDWRLGYMDRLIINAVLIPIVFVVAIVFLVRNIRARRIDGSGTIKLVGAVAVLSMAKWLLLADHIYHPLSDHSVILWSSWNVPMASLSAALF